MTSRFFIEFHDSDFEPFVAMATKLWKEYDRSDLRELLSGAQQRDNLRIWLAKDEDDRYVGFVIFSIRTDYVEGAVTSPTGYLEGIYVEPEFRKRGIAREFLRLGEAWCKEKGCVQLGSDTWLTDMESRTIHKKLGFREEEEVVHFLKDLG